jgi:CheY-like chemotaxis protein
MPESRRILVVDDCPDITESTEMLLRLWGYEVRTANDGRTALEVAAQFVPHAVLLDLAMPGMDGLELARLLRRLPALARGLLVAVSGYTSDTDMQQSRAAGCDCYLVKPVDPDGLLRLLDSHTRDGSEDLSKVTEGNALPKRRE